MSEPKTPYIVVEDNGSPSATITILVKDGHVLVSEFGNGSEPASCTTDTQAAIEDCTRRIRAAVARTGGDR